MPSVSPTRVDLSDLEFHAERFDPAAVARTFREHGCAVVRGLMREHVDAVCADIERTAQQSIALLEAAQRVSEGWKTPDGTLFLPAPPGWRRDRQIMVLGISYLTSAAFLRSALDPRVLDVVAAILGPDVELFLNGQCLYKEPTGGHPKHLHQDASYFEHRFDGPVAVLTYGVDTDLANGALHVIPGSHQLGTLRHVDTFSHLGLDPDEWRWEDALPIPGRAGDSILFHYRLIHGSQENRSALPRPAFIHRYRRPDDYVTVSATSAARRQEAERRAAEARKENQRGLMVGGFRPYQPVE